MEVGVHRGTVKRWMAREDFRAAVDRARTALLDRNPGPQATLEAALTATKANGSPDWQVPVLAARALLGREPNGDSPTRRSARQSSTLTGFRTPGEGHPGEGRAGDPRASLRPTG